MDKFKKSWRNWPLKNTSFLILSLLIFVYIAELPAVDNFIKGLGSFRYLGSFIAGFFFVSTYTVAPAGYVLFELAKFFNPLQIALVAGLGSMLGDYVIFRFIRDRVADELKPYLAKIGAPKLREIFHTPYFAWLLPISGALIIASPLPDEIGVSLLGASKIKNTHFLIFSYLLNAVGILIIVLLARN